MTKTMAVLITIFLIILCANFYVQAQTIEQINVSTDDLPTFQDGLQSKASGIQAKIIGHQKQISDCNDLINSLQPQIDNDVQEYDHIETIINSYSYLIPDNEENP